MDARMKYRELLSTYSSSSDFKNFEEFEIMASIIPPTPISKRRHKDDGFVSEINVYIADDHRRVMNIFLPIKYCPMCGKEVR